MILAERLRGALVDSPLWKQSLLRWLFWRFFTSLKMDQVRESNSALAIKSSPARQSAGLLSVRTAGGDRTRYTSGSYADALSNELQRYAIRNLD